MSEQSMAKDETPIILCGLVGNGPYPFDDNIEGFCESCGAAILWRPHAPEGRRMCLECGMECVRLAQLEGEVPEYRITKETENDLAALGWFLKKPSQTI